MHEIDQKARTMNKPVQLRTVVIVDDSAVLRKEIACLLADYPTIEVVGEAGHVAAGMDLILRLRPDFVILDISMPGGSGLQLLGAIKNGASAPKVIMLTNYPEVCFRSQASILGADFFFDKSIECDKIADAILHSS